MNTHASGFLGRFCKPVTAVLAGLSLIAGVLHAAPMPAQAAEAYKRNTDILVQANDGNPVHSTVNVALYTVDPSVCTDTKTLENLTEVNGVNSNAKSSVLQDKDYAAGDCVLTKVSYRKNENSGNYRFRISGRDADKDTSGAVGTFVGAYYVGANGDLKRDETALWGSGVPYDNLPATYYEKPKVNERNAAAVDAGNAISTAYGADLYFVRTMPENAPAAAVISWNVTYRELEQTPDGWVDKGNDNTEIPSIIISKPTSTEETSTEETSTEDSTSAETSTDEPSTSEEPPTPEEPTSTPATTKTGTATVDLGAGITESNWSDYEDKIRYQIGVGPSGRAVYDSKNPFTDAGKSFTYSEGDQVRARIQFNIGTAEDPQWVTSASSDTTAGTEDVSVSLADTNAVDKLAALEVVEKLKDETGVDSTCTDAAAVITAQDWEAKKKFLAECIDKRVLAGMEEWAKMARAIVGEANAAAVDQALQDVKDELETVDLSVGLDAYYAARLALYRTLAVEFADKINTSGLLSTEIDTGKLTGETLSGVDKAMSDQFNGKSLAEITEEKQQEAKENAVTDIPKSVNAVVEAQVANDKNVLSEAQRAVINEQLQAIVNDNTLTLEQKLAKADALKKAIGQLGTAIITANAAVVKAENELAGKDALLSRLAVLTAKLNTESSKGDATGQSVDQAREEYQLKVENLKTEATEESSAPTDTEEFRKELETTENGSQSNPNDSNNTVEPSTPRASTSSGSSSWWQILLIVLGLLGIGSAIAYGIQQQQMNR